MNLRIRDISIRLDDFKLEADLHCPEGELVTLLGPSGCGKTTLLRIIAGLYFPDRGSVFLGDRDITRLDPRHRKIGMVFQDYALFPHMTVLKNICYGMKEKGPEALRKAGSLLDMVQLSSYGKRKPDELSGGEMQRVALARALASSPDLLLLDEPLSALDAKLRRTLRRQIREIQQETGITAVYVTHDQEEAMAISDRIVLMDRGRISQTGTPESLYSSPANTFAGGFIGTANMIRIHGAEKEKKQIRTDTDIGSLLLPPSLLDESGTEWQDLKGKMLYFRPEECRLGPPEKESIAGKGGGGGGGGGEILYREYGGDFIYLEVRSGKSIVRLKSRTGAAFRRGESVSWSVSPSSCLIIG